MPHAVLVQVFALTLSILPVSTAKADPFLDAALDRGPAGKTGLAAPGESAVLAGRAAQTFSKFTSAEGNLRGAKEANVFRQASPSVVMVLTEDGGLGSGSLIAPDGTILTNWHVVGASKEVGVIFKPKEEGRKVVEADLRLADVLHVDQVADLALIKLREPPPKGVQPLKIGDMSKVAVGADVHAIGHPTGETWTYTRGLISQIRKDYEWVAGEKKALKHKGHVIQHQTPINPGNSGGPLLNESGEIVGVNTFGADGEGLNFAVAGDEVQRFMARTSDRMAETAERRERACQPAVLFEGRTKTNDGELMVVELVCGQPGRGTLLVPDDKTKPIRFFLDYDGDGGSDGVVVDENRDGRWDISLYDTDEDGEPETVGYHDDGSLRPVRLGRYTPPPPDGVRKTSGK